MMSDATPDARDRALVFAGGGEILPRSLASRLPAGALVIAADSGVEHAQHLGCPIDLVVGDLDSVDAEALEQARVGGAAVDVHPAAKDFTDLELALAAARARSATTITVVGGYGGRLDHFLANVLVLASPALEGCSVDAWFGETYLCVVRTEHELRGHPGSLCTLLPLGGVARGVTTTGLRFPLRDEDLLPGSTRGLSNVLLGESAQVAVRAGTVLSIQPQALEEL
jgi:thiamine pyrophosphokinase